MIEIEFSTIHNDEGDLRTIRELLDEFEQAHGIRVHLTRMLRGTAWPDLMAIASTGKGPDVSHVGSSWVSSLAAMNAIRPFRPNEVALTGGETTYIPSAWQDTQVLGEDGSWSVPWNSFLFTIFYRRDLFAKAGIEGTTAFASVPAIGETIARLNEAGIEIPWLIPYAAPPFDGLLHMAASWVWGAGGNFVNADGTRLVLDAPKALHGLTGWLDSHRAVPANYRQLSEPDCIELLVQGRSGAVIGNVRSASALIARIGEDRAREQIGFATMTAVPWCGGDSLVLWQHTQGYPDRQKAALELIRFLSGAPAQVRLAHQAHLMPTRHDALTEAYPAGHPLHEVADQAARSGRAYLSIRLWRRTEYQLSQTIGALLQDALQNPTRDSEELVRSHIEPVVERLNLVLGS
jgi:multiple sugar transport system substrate-binding protein